MGLLQRSALSPFLFIVFLELISRKSKVTNQLKKVIYADDLALEASLNDWNNIFTQHGLRLNKDKMEVMAIAKEHRDIMV